MKIYWHQGAISLSINSISNVHLSIHELLQRWNLMGFFFAMPWAFKMKIVACSRFALYTSSTVFVAKKATIKMPFGGWISDSLYFEMFTFKWIAWKQFNSESLVENEREHWNDTYSFRQSSTRLSSLDSSSSIKLLACHIGMVRIQMEMLMRVSTLN